MITGRFIGVDRFLDPAIHDLTGCVRDANAMWAIFSDGVPGLGAQLLVNEQATAARVRLAIDETLGAATEGDAVVLSLATHGTRDHRIVAYDTRLADLDGTTVSLSELIEKFRTSRASFIFCVIDCCFAGEAPARVVMETPTSRALIDFQAISGVGRLILTASRADEPAYEHPRRRHGLLTAALLDILTEQNVGGVLSIVDRVIGRVRADANAIGVQQNPVATTYIDGGFTLPTLVRGDTFRAAFPEYGAARVQDIDGMAAFGIPNEIVEAWSRRFNNHLHDLQLDAINEFRVLDGQSLFVVAPTSSGKTFIGEIAAVRAILDRRKAVFLLPFKALVNEKFDEFSSLYGTQLGLRVIRCTGDYHDQMAEFLAGKFDIAILTYEMFLSVVVANLAVLNLIGLVVVDEAQFITDESRGITVELILTLFRAHRSRGIEPQLILLSAVVGNVTQFGDWLDVRVLTSEDRPVPLDFGALDRSGIYEYVDENGQRQQTQLIPAGHIFQRGRNPSAQDVLVPLTQQLIRDGAAQENIIVFRNSRGSAEGSAAYLSRELSLPPAADAIAALPMGDLSSVSAKLRETLRGGTAFHNSNLSRDERVVVERAFRDRDGGIRILTATSGVGAGINTPASTVVIAETNWAGPENQPMSLGDVRNMAGRAGRYGYRETGRAIILSDTPWRRTALVDHYVMSAPDAISSSFKASDIPTWVLRLLRQVDRIPRNEVATLLVNTFGGFLASTRDPNFAQRTSDSISQLLDRMIADGLVDQNQDGVQLTAVGRVCGQSILSLESCLQILEALRRIGAVPLTPEMLLVLTQSLRESDETYVPMLKRGTWENRWHVAAAQRFGRETASETSRNAPDALTIVARAKRSLIAVSWSDGMPIERIEREFSNNPYRNNVAAGDIRGIADAVRFRMRSVYDIVAVATPAIAPDPRHMDQFLTQLEYGIPRVALALLEGYPNLSRAEYMAIVQAGFSSVEELKLPLDELSRRLPRSIAEKIARANTA